MRHESLLVRDNAVIQLLIEEQTTRASFVAERLRLQNSYPLRTLKESYQVDRVQNGDSRRLTVLTKQRRYPPTEAVRLCLAAAEEYRHRMEKSPVLSAVTANQSEKTALHHDYIKCMTSQRLEDQTTVENGTFPIVAPRWRIDAPQWSVRRGGRIHAVVRKFCRSAEISQSPVNKTAVNEKY